MGGRSKEPKDQVNSFSFLSDISNERLENYGKYSSGAYQNRDYQSFTDSGIPSNPTELNSKAADEYITRTGKTPSWDLRSNGATAHHKET